MDGTADWVDLNVTCYTIISECLSAKHVKIGEIVINCNASCLQVRN